MAVAQARLAPQTRLNGKRGELKDEIKRLKVEIKAEGKKLDAAAKEEGAAAKALEKAQQAEQKLRLQLQSLVDQTGAAEEALAETRKRSAEGEAELVEIEARVKA